MPLPDAGSSADSGVDAGPPVSLDAGADAGPMCAEDLVEPYTTRPCSAATKTCIEACTEPSCFDTCVDSDPVRACRDCVNRAFISCFNRNGCQPMWNCYRACIRENCTMAPDVVACIDEHCREAEQTYYDCIDAAFDTSPCPGRYVDCLPEG